MNTKSFNKIKNAINEKKHDLKILENLPKRIIILEKQIKDIEEQIKQLKRNPDGFGKKNFCMSRKTLITKRNDLSKNVKSLKTTSYVDEISIIKRDINNLEVSINSFNQNKHVPVEISTIGSSDLKSLFLEWKNINFCDGYVEFKINHYYHKFRVEQSKRYLNSIKFYYSFKNVPKLEIVISGTEIVEIKNIEILFYHIDFLTISGQSFETVKFDISNLKKYTNTYYKKHIPFAFTTESLKFLCEICDETFPIIPMPELVINSGKSKVIHNSFLFKCGNKLIWESIEPSKATYIFEFINFDNDAQQLFDYITNENNRNKRQNLIHNFELLGTLKLYNRIFHKHFSEWKNVINCIIQ